VPERVRIGLCQRSNGSGKASSGVRRVDFRGAFGRLMMMAHTSAAPAGASECFVDERRLRSVSEALPLNGSPADLLRS
jgi:hypothetical protein